MTARILVIGDAMLDRYWSGVVERMSPEAAVPVLRLEEQTARAGGAANVAVNLARLGCNVTLAGLIGRDEAGTELVELLAKEKVAWQGLPLDGATTTVKIRHTTHHQHLLRTDIEAQPHADCVMTFTNHLVLQMLRGFDFVVLSDYAKGALGRCESLISAAPCPVLVDPKGTNWARYRGAWLLKPNAAELAAVVGHWGTQAEMEQKAEDLRASLDVNHMLVTCGADGMILVSEDGCMQFPAQARQVFDVTGAGDTVIATLTRMLSLGAPLFDAVCMANRAAGIAVGKFGTVAVTAEELEAS